jgi:hypothetical protein
MEPQQTKSESEDIVADELSANDDCGGKEDDDEESLSDIILLRSHGLDHEKQQERERASLDLQISSQNEARRIDRDFESQGEGSQTSLLDELAFQAGFPVASSETERKKKKESSKVEAGESFLVNDSRGPQIAGEEELPANTDTIPCTSVVEAAPPLTALRRTAALSQPLRPGAYSVGAPGTGLVRNETVPFALVGLTNVDSVDDAAAQVGATETSVRTISSGDDGATTVNTIVRDRNRFATNTVQDRDSDSNLVTANLVPEEDIVDPEDLTRAELVSSRRQELERHQHDSKLVRRMAVCLVLILVAGFVSVAVTLLRLREKGAKSMTQGAPLQVLENVGSMYPSSSPTSSPLPPCWLDSTNRSKEELLLLDDIVLDMPAFIADHTRCHIYRNSSSPQTQAFEWVLKDPNLPSLPVWRIQQRFVLATLYYATNGTDWLRSDKWLDYEENECFWHHSSERFAWGNFKFEGHPPCGADYNRSTAEGGIYKHIWLEGVGMQGTLPLELFTMTSLEILSMASVGYDLIFDEETGLQTENFGSSPFGLSGPIPSELGLLTNLNYLFLNENKFSSTIPSEIGLLTNLKGLDFKFNSDITGRLPEQIGRLTSLETLDLVDTNLIGPAFPKALLQLTDLKYLHLKGNAFTGTIPTEVGVFSSLINMALDQQFLTGSIPSEVGLLSNLRILYLSNNQLTGTIPRELSQCSSMIILDIHSNSIEGKIPTEVAAMSNMGFFQLNSNQLRGTIPTEIGLQAGVYWLDFSSNYLSGAFPSSEFIQDFRFLHLLFLDNNPQLTGTIPENLMTDSFAYRLKLENTGFSGTIPNHLCRLQGRLEFDCHPQSICGCDCSCPSNRTAINVEP